jgi:hypothetical protein
MNSVPNIAEPDLTDVNKKMSYMLDDRLEMPVEEKVEPAAKFR